MGELLTSEQVAKRIGVTVGRVNQIAQRYGIGRKYGSVRLYTDKDAELIRANRGKIGRPRGRK